MSCIEADHDTRRRQQGYLNPEHGCRLAGPRSGGIDDEVAFERICAMHPVIEDLYAGGRLSV